MDKLSKNCKSLSSFVSQPTRNKQKANLFLSQIIKELKSTNKTFRKRSEDNITNKSTSIQDDESLNNEDINQIDKLHDYQKWMLIEGDLKENLSYFESFKNPVEHLKNIEKEISAAEKKVDILIGKKRKLKSYNEMIKEEEEVKEDGNSVENEEENMEDDIEEDSFNMDDFEKFNQEIEEEDQENEPNQGSNDEDEMYDENLEDKDDIKYNDIFKQIKKEKKINDKEVEDEVFAIEHGYFENDSMIPKINNLEKKMVGEKDWQLKGEINAKSRPVGSLLENNLDFKVTRRPPPIITAEWSNKIEQIIKTRVASDLFDDPKRTMIKEKKENQDINIIFEKSSKGLAELYEEDWNKQYNNSKEEKTQDKIEIEEMMSDLFTMFTALTNSTFIGDRVKNDNNAIKDIEAIEIKDVSKFVSSDKLLKNNFEKTINNYNPKKAETTTKTEQTVDENKKSRRQMKRKVHKKIYEKNLKKKMNSLSKDYDSKFEVKMAMKKQKDKDDKTNIKSNELKSSKFFNNLQQKREEGNTAKTVESENKKAKLFKL